MAGSAGKQIWSVPMDFQELQGTNRQRVVEWLEDGERMVNSGSAQSVEIAERVGRGGGEGILMLTNRRLLFQLDSQTFRYGGLAIPLTDVMRVAVKRTIVPGMRELLVGTNSDGETGRSNFYVGKHFAKELVSQIMR